MNLIKQLATLKPGQKVDWGKVAGATVKGAIIGGVAGATGGLSLLQYAGASAVASAVGGSIGRATEVVANNVVLDWNPEALENIEDYALDTDSILVDGIAGAAGGLFGKYLEGKAISQAGATYLNNSAYNRAVQTIRNIGGKSDRQINESTQTVQSGLNKLVGKINLMF